MATLTADQGATRNARSPASLILWWHLIRLDLRRSQGYVAAALILLMAPLTGLKAEDADGYILWWNVNAGILKSAALIAAPVTAALAAWLIDRDRRCRANELTNATAIPAFRRDLAIVTMASFWGLVGLLGISIRFIWPAIRADAWGGPNPLLIALGCLTVVFGSALGCVVGRVIQSRYAPILAFVGMFGLTVAAEVLFPGNTSPTGEYSQFQPFRYLMPWVYGSNLSEAGSMPWGLMLNGCAWMALITVTATALLALLRKRNLLTVTTLGLASIAAFLVAAPLVEQATSGPDGPYDLSPQPVELTCQVMRGFEICLHPAYASQVQDNVSIQVDALEPLLGLPGLPTRLEQSGNWTKSSADAWNLYIQNPRTDLLNLFDQIMPYPVDTTGGGGMSSRPASQLTILTWLFQRSGVDEQPMDFGPSQAPSELMPEEAERLDGNTWYPPTYNENELAAWRTRIDDAAARFAALGPVAQRAWLEVNWTALVAGTLPFEALP